VNGKTIEDIVSGLLKLDTQVLRKLKDMLAT
jgi:hypothetical protein